MGIFNRFSDTIFLKSDSELEKEIEELKNIREQMNDKEKIDLDIKKCELGLYGEKQIEYELKSSDIGMYVLHDITLDYEDMIAQIDYVICTPACMYIIECKNLIGDITVDNKGEFVREFVVNGRRIKESIYSPYRQAQRHIELLKKRWLKSSNKLNILLKENCFDNWYKPLVVFANSKGILNIKYAPKEIKDHVIRLDQLNDYLKKEVEKISWEEKYSEKLMKSNAEGFLNANIERKRDLISKYNLNDLSANNDINIEALEQALREFRTNKSKEKNIPAYYVFTNDELSNILNIIPRTIDELSNSKVLHETKVKFHGKEIIEIINKF